MRPRWQHIFVKPVSRGGTDLVALVVAVVSPSVPGLQDPRAHHERPNYNALNVSWRDRFPAMSRD